MKLSAISSTVHVSFLLSNNIYADENLYTGKEKAFQNEFWFPK